MSRLPAGSPGEITLPTLGGPFISDSYVAIENWPRALRTWQPPQRALRIGAMSFTKLTPAALLVLAAAFAALVEAGFGSAGLVPAGLASGGFSSGRLTPSTSSSA